MCRKLHVFCSHFHAYLFHCLFFITLVNIWPALTDLILYDQFQKASGVVGFSCELQVGAFSNYYFSCSEDVQTADNVTANHVTMDVTEGYVQVSCVTRECANQRHYFKWSSEFLCVLENISIISVIVILLYFSCYSCNKMSSV